MVIGAQRSGDNLGTEAMHSHQRKVTKMQQTGIKPMAASTQRTDSGPRAEANHNIRKVQRKGKSLKNVSTQRADHNLMAVL